MRCHKGRQILLYHVPNKLFYPTKNAHQVLFLFCQLRYERGLLSGFSKLHQNKLQEEDIQDVINIMKINFEQNVD